MFITNAVLEIVLQDRDNLRYFSMKFLAPKLSVNIDHIYNTYV